MAECTCRVGYHNLGAGLQPFIEKCPLCKAAPRMLKALNKMNILCGPYVGELLRSEMVAAIALAGSVPAAVEEKR